MALNQKQKEFIRHWFNCFVATEAAKRAGYSERSAYQIGHQLLKNVEVKKAMEEIYQDRQSQFHADGLYVKSKLLAVSEADWSKFVIMGRAGINDIESIPEEIRKMITSIDRVETTYGRGEDRETTVTYKFKLMDKTKCLELLGRAQGLFADRKIIEGELKIRSFTDLVKEVNKDY